jgi:hypothetical protein
MDSLIGMMMGYGMDGWGLISSEGNNFTFSTASKLALRPTQFPIQWVLGAPSLGVKWQGHEADHSPPSSAEVKNGGALPPFPHIFMVWRFIN